MITPGHPRRAQSRGRLTGAMIALLAVLLAGLAGGCSAGEDATAPSPSPTSPSVSATDNPYGVLDIDPAEPGESILEVENAAGATTELSLEALKEMASVRMTVSEPFLKTEQTFVGVPLSAIIEKAGVSASSSLLTIALNDYRWTGSVQQMLDSDALVAYEVDGRAIGYDEGGPIRLVYPDGSELSKVLDAWNWSLKELKEQ